MNYILNTISELITEKEPAPGNETIILVNGFEELKLYSELASKIRNYYQGTSLKINIKLAKRKWIEFSETSDRAIIQQMIQNEWVADKESVTFYRNQHQADILILFGTEDEEDTGGLANCFTITPDTLISNLDGHYYLIFESCFNGELSNDDKMIIDKAYSSLFEYCPVDICKLSNISDEWYQQFDTIYEFCEEFGKKLKDWGLPGRTLESFKPRNFRTKTNALLEVKNFISGKVFQRMSQRAYKGLVKKIDDYAEEGNYILHPVDWEEYGFNGYKEFAGTLLEFARGENVHINRERLLNIDYAIIKDILKNKAKTPPITKVGEKSISGEPLDVFMRTGMSALKYARVTGRTDLEEIQFNFKNAIIVTGYTDVDDDEKKRILAETWRNICVHVNGVFEFINQNTWKFFDEQMAFSYANAHFFDPKKVLDQLDNTVTVASGTNTLNKIQFSIKLLDENGNVLQEEKKGNTFDMEYHYVWKFDNETPWLYDFKDLIVDEELSAPGASRIPLTLMGRIKNTMVIKSDEEFFDIYDEDSLDLSFDIGDYVSKKAAKSNDYELKHLGIMFSDLGSTFCDFVRELSSKGFYNVLCGDIITRLNERYLAIADKILSIKFDENKQWIKDAFLQSFVILDSVEYIEEDMEPGCVIIPPWHPAALQKISDQKNFLIDGLSQKVSEFDEEKCKLNIDSLMDRFIRMTEIQSTIDLFPANGNDYMGVIGTYGHFCVYGDEKNISAIKTRMKDVIRKEAIYDEDFRASELTKMNDDARMIYDILNDYVKAMPSVKCSLSIVFINPPDLQPIISAVSKYTRDIHSNDSEALINLKLTILVRPENKGGKSYLTYWMDDYFSEENNTSVRIYLNEWSKKNELDKLLSENNDIVFNMDLLHADSFRFLPNPGEKSGKVSDCRFPIVYKPTPLSKTSRKRKIEITQTQFSASFRHTQVVRYKKNPEMIPQGSYLAVRETSVENETKKIIDILHKKAYWVVCIDKVMDGALLRSDDSQNTYAIIGFSTGKGMYGQYNLTITARNSILKTVEKKLKDRLYKLFCWNEDILELAVKKIMKEASGLDGISLLSAINQKSTKINEFMAYVITSLREKELETDSVLKVIIHLDSYNHWFDNSDNEDVSMRPDFLMLSVMPSEDIIKIKATVIECKTASYNNYYKHVSKAEQQVLHGLKQLKALFDPSTDSIERRYWYAQLYRALVFAQVTFSDASDEYIELTGKLRSILDGDFEIEWDGKMIGYWVDLQGDSEIYESKEHLTICNIPQICIQKILTDNDEVNYVTVDSKILGDIDEIAESEREQEAEQEFKRKRDDIIRRKKTSVIERQSYNQNNDVKEEKPISEDLTLNEGSKDKSPIEVEVEIERKKEMESVNGTISDSSLLNDEPIDSLEEMRVLIGSDRKKNDVYWEFGHKGLSNRHLLITGTSGQGKTYGIQSMLYEVSKFKVSMVVFDYTEGFRLDQLEKKFLDKMSDRIDNKVIYFTGVPINPFKQHEIEVAGMKAPEKISDVAQRIASTLTHVYDFGDQQFAAIYDACYSGLSKYGNDMSMKFLEDELNNSTNKSAKSVVSKMTPFLHSVDFSEGQCDWNDILYNETGKLTIFQLTSFVRDIQVIITEFMLWDMWHFAKKNGNKDKPFIVVLDEAQNLSHADNSPSGLILTEGRKFGWSAWYATQSLKILNDDEITRLMQSAFKLYFKPTDSEIISMAKQLNPSDANEWKVPLTSLKKGECIVVGDRIHKDGVFKSGRPTITKVISFEKRE